jgi:hypothetical protein
VFNKVPVPVLVPSWYCISQVPTVPLASDKQSPSPERKLANLNPKLKKILPRVIAPPHCKQSMILSKFYTKDIFSSVKEKHKVISVCWSVCLLIMHNKQQTMIKHCVGLTKKVLTVDFDMRYE